jgi:hypothetical protein
MAGHKHNAMRLQSPQQRVTNKRKRAANRILIRDAIEEARDYGMDAASVNQIPVLDALQNMLNRSYSIWSMVAEQVDCMSIEDMWAQVVDRDGNVYDELTKWPAMEAAMRQEVFDMAARMQGLNVDERLARVEEVKTEMLGRALVAAAREAGLDEETQKRLGQHLRIQIAQLQSGPLPADLRSQAVDTDGNVIEGRESIKDHTSSRKGKAA